MEICRSGRTDFTANEGSALVDRGFKSPYLRQIQAPNFRINARELGVFLVSRRDKRPALPTLATRAAC